MKISNIIKYIDSPKVLNKLHKHMPKMLVATGAIAWSHDAYHNSKKPVREKHDNLKSAIVIASAVGASLMGARGLKIGGKTIFKGLINNSANEAKNVTSKEIFSEIKRLSLLGLIPVVGGVAGGIAADKITCTGSKKSTANKVKEGIYQYLANIFMCNVGAGAALYGAEKLAAAGKIKNLTPNKKLFIILGGIFATGIIGGSYIANLVGKHVVNPLMGEKKSKHGVYGERVPEALDVALHVDDIATAGVLSGFKWVEPALPLLYFLSGYRAGIGYRNHENKHA